MKNMLRNVSVVAVALSVAILFGCIGTHDYRQAKAQTKAASPASVDTAETPFVVPVDPLPEPPKPDEPAVHAGAEPTQLLRCNCDVRINDLQKQVNELRKEVMDLRDEVRKKSAVVQKPVPAPGWKLQKIVFHTQPNCIYCDQWLATNKTKVDADGIQFEVSGPDSRGTPAFDVHWCNEGTKVCRQIKFSNVPYETMKAVQPKD